MKKIIILNTVLLLGLVGFLTSCESDESADKTQITYFVKFELNGNAVTLVPVNSNYVDEGVIATEGDEDVTGSVQVTSNVNTAKKGLYTVTYSATNADGFPNTVSRQVIVYDPNVTTDIAGDYSVDLSYSNRLQLSNNAVINYSDMKGLYGAGDFSSFAVTLTTIAPGIFNVSDLFGGYYVEGRAYDARYNMVGIISLNADNTLSLLTSKVAGWGDGLDALRNATYDPATGDLQWAARYTGTYDFNVKLIKK